MKKIIPNREYHEYPASFRAAGSCSNGAAIAGDPADLRHRPVQRGGDATAKASGRRR
jgi:hypothetical protein